LFILLLLAIGIPSGISCFASRRRRVSFEMFVQGAQTSLLQTCRIFPVRIVGLALLAIHFVARFRRRHWDLP
jgi:hypothetical protein